MAKMKSGTKKLSFISVPSQIIHSLSVSTLPNLLPSSPKKPAANSFSGASARRFISRVGRPKFLALLLFFFAFVCILMLGLDPAIHRLPAAVSSEALTRDPAPVLGGAGGGGEFWRQPNGMGYRPCLNFSEEYRNESAAAKLHSRGRRKYLVVVVSGGLNQQKNQIVDAVVIARILGAALVVPIFQVNVIWNDPSEFSDIFDLDHFKRVLADDVRVFSSLPSTLLMTRPVEQQETPLHASSEWILRRYSRRLNKVRVLLLRSLDSRLSKDLPPDLQKLRCKDTKNMREGMRFVETSLVALKPPEVAFDALKFSAPIQELGTKLAARMRSNGPFLALHLRMEKDVWVRTGCLPGLSPEHDEIIRKERMRRPELLTASSNMTYHERKLAGFCPLNALEVTRLLKALGAPKNSMIYWAGGESFGGPEALRSLITEFPYVYNKENLLLPGELEPFSGKASFLAAIDYIVCEKSDVFMASHGGNMGHLMRGHRAFSGHKKFITPNKRQMLPYFLDASLEETEFNQVIEHLHRRSIGQPEVRIGKLDKDVTAYPVPECMCDDRRFI